MTKSRQAKNIHFLFFIRIIYLLNINETKRSYMYVLKQG